MIIWKIYNIFIKALLWKLYGSFIKALKTLYYKSFIKKLYIKGLQKLYKKVHVYMYLKGHDDIFKGSLIGYFVHFQNVIGWIFSKLVISQLRKKSEKVLGTCKCSIWPSKPLGFLMFSEGRERVHWEQIG